MLDNLFAGLDNDIDFSTKEVDNVFGRCIYLLHDLQITLPSWIEAKIPNSKELKLSRSMRSPLIEDAFKKGKGYGKGDIPELKQVLDNLIWQEMNTFEERQKFINFLSSLETGLFSTNIEKPFSEIEGKEIPKFDSGFSPLDKAVKGFYQGLGCFAGLPGSGKTSVLLNVSAQLAKQSPIWYFQTEIPSELIESRIELLEPKKFHKDSRFFAGNYSATTILEKVLKNPCKDRIIVYDSPEIKATGGDDLVYWEQTLQELVQIKLQSKLVFFTSQIKQNISWDELGMYSLSGSANKARYCDLIIYLNNFSENLMCKTAKNRFGSLGSSMTKYNYETMKIEEDFVSELF